MNAGRQLNLLCLFLLAGIPVESNVYISLAALCIPSQPFPPSPDMAAKTHEGITRTILSQAQTIVHDVYVSFVRKD